MPQQAMHIVAAVGGADPSDRLHQLRTSVETLGLHPLWCQRRAAWWRLGWLAAAQTTTSMGLATGGDVRSCARAGGSVHVLPWCCTLPACVMPVTASAPLGLLPDQSLVALEW